MTNKQANSGIIYQGPSLIDGAPIVVIATYSTRNTKTGAMVQTYILRSDIDPRDANKSGADYSICGNCPHKGTPTDNPNKKLADDRLCYVVIGQGPTAVFKSFKRGVYGDMKGHEKTAELGRGRMVRLGTYGDPAAVPSDTWDSLLSDSAGHTAYSHQSGIKSADIRPDLFMISADNEAQARAAWDSGARTFRIVSDYSELVSGKEIPCPADTKGIECRSCGLCKGASKAKSIAIVVHGNGAKYIAA
jgi:hypothetical protein